MNVVRVCSKEPETYSVLLYVSNKSKELDNRNYIWRAITENSLEVIIKPEDKNYTIGPYYIGIYGIGESSNDFELIVTLEEPSIDIINISNHSKYRR